MKRISYFNFEVIPVHYEIYPKGNAVELKIKVKVNEKEFSEKMFYDFDHFESIWEQIIKKLEYEIKEKIISVV